MVLIKTSTIQNTFMEQSSYRVPLLNFGLFHIYSYVALARLYINYATQDSYIVKSTMSKVSLKWCTYFLCSNWLPYSLYTLTTEDVA